MYQTDQLGFGTTQFWYGTDHASFSCMRKAVNDYGIRMIDTAEMYGYGECEKAVGKLIRETGREQLYVIDKILPENANRKLFFSSLEGSLKRLGTDHIDLYLLHWRDQCDLAEMSSLMERAKQQGKILEWGVSNFDIQDMEDLLACPEGKYCRVNQIFYNPLHRGIEYELMPYLKERGIRIMSYSSLDTYSARNRLKNNPAVREILRKENISIEGLMLRFNIEHDVITLFQTSSSEHLKTDLEGMQFDYASYRDIIDAACPPPSRRIPLEKR